MIKKRFVYSMRAKTIRQTVALLDLNQEHARIDHSNFSSPSMSMNDHKKH